FVALQLTRPSGVYVPHRLRRWRPVLRARGNLRGDVHPVHPERGGPDLEIGALGRLRDLPHPVHVRHAVRLRRPVAEGFVSLEGKAGGPLGRGSPRRRNLGPEGGRPWRHGSQENRDLLETVGSLGSAGFPQDMPGMSAASGPEAFIDPGQSATDAGPGNSTEQEKTSCASSSWVLRSPRRRCWPWPLVSRPRTTVPASPTRRSRSATPCRTPGRHRPTAPSARPMPRTSSTSTTRAASTAARSTTSATTTATARPGPSSRPASWWSRTRCCCSWG